MRKIDVEGDGSRLGTFIGHDVGAIEGDEYLADAGHALGESIAEAVQGPADSFGQDVDTGGGDPQVEPAGHYGMGVVRG